MTLSCTARALKFSLFVFNLVFLLCGVVCVGIGTWLALDKYAIDQLASATAQIQGYEQEEALRDLATKPTAVRQIGYVLLFGGLLVITVAFLGCCGAAKEWRPLLCCYATCLMIILATEIAAAIYAAMHSHMFENDFREILRASLRMYNGTDSPGKKNADGMLMKAAWDKLMVEKLCCGVDSKIGEFNESGWFLLTKGRYMFPPACCPLDMNGKLKPDCQAYARHGDGCYAKIVESFHELTSHFKIVAWTVVFIALIQALISIRVMYRFLPQWMHFERKSAAVVVEGFWPMVLILPVSGFLLERDIHEKMYSELLWASGFATLLHPKTTYFEEHALFKTSHYLQGCIIHMFQYNRLQFSAAFGIFFVLSMLQIFGCTLCIALYDRIKKEMLHYY